MDLFERRAFLALSLEERRRFMEETCTEEIVCYYNTEEKVREWLEMPMGKINGKSSKPTTFHSDEL